MDTKTAHTFGNRSTVHFGPALDKPLMAPCENVWGTKFPFLCAYLPFWAMFRISLSSFLIMFLILTSIPIGNDEKHDEKLMRN